MAMLTALMTSGAFWFGVVVGYLTYRTIKHTQKTGIADIAAIIAAIGGGVVVGLFPIANGRFDYYAIGLAAGFFIYLVLSLYLGLTRSPGKADQLLGDKVKKQQ
jgi:NhaP-type Na+/H+ or K+/H+ antiporter